MAMSFLDSASAPSRLLGIATPFTMVNNDRIWNITRKQSVHGQLNLDGKLELDPDAYHGPEAV